MPEMRTSSIFSRIGISPEDFLDIKESLECRTGYWRLRATFAPSPGTKSGASLWVYLFWVGPPSVDIVPAVAITRRIKEYRVTILDPMEYFASGAFETIDCIDLASAIQTILAVIDEACDNALRPRCLGSDSGSFVLEEILQQIARVHELDSLDSEDFRLLMNMTEFGGLPSEPRQLAKPRMLAAACASSDEPLAADAV